MSADFKLKYNFLEDEFWKKFIEENYNKSLDKVLFSINKNKEIDSSILANQLKGKKIVEVKVPSWKKYKNIIFPPGLNMEQCSSELTAIYKSHLVNGESCVDITGGLGIDSYFLSKSFKQTWHCEKNNELQFIAKKNFKTLSSDIQSESIDGLEFLKSTNKYFDLIYIDPSRRNSYNKKVILLEDYTPNILENINLLLQKGKQILLKTTPLLDIKKVLIQLPHVKEVHVVAVNNECKELLFLFDSKANYKPAVIYCKDLIKDINFDFYFSDEEKCADNLSLPLKYLYEPNVCILKGGGFKSITNQYRISKLHPNSHLYTSNNYIKSFPGRCFEIIADCGLNKKDLLANIKSKKANITRRNFPLSVKDIRKKIGFTEGGKDYLFATTLLDESKRILVCKKILVK